MQRDNSGEQVAQITRSLNAVTNELKKIDAVTDELSKIRELLERIEQKMNPDK